MEEPIDLEQYKNFLDYWKAFSNYTLENNNFDSDISQSLEKFIDYINKNRIYKYHQHGADEYNNIWESLTES